jgi:hypothetical protein
MAKVQNHKRKPFRASRLLLLVSLFPFLIFSLGCGGGGGGSSGSGGSNPVGIGPGSSPNYSTLTGKVEVLATKASANIRGSAESSVLEAKGSWRAYLCRLNGEEVAANVPVNETGFFSFENVPPGTFWVLSIRPKIGSQMIYLERIITSFSGVSDAPVVVNEHSTALALLAMLSGFSRSVEDLEDAAKTNSDLQKMLSDVAVLVGNAVFASASQSAETNILVEIASTINIPNLEAILRGIPTTINSGGTLSGEQENRLSIALVEPLNNSIFPAGVPISLVATASGEGIAAVAFFRDEEKVGETSRPPFRVTWSTPSSGAHYLTARAISLDGRIFVSEGVGIHVTPSALPLVPSQVQEVGSGTTVTTETALSEEGVSSESEKYEIPLETTLSGPGEELNTLSMQIYVRNVPANYEVTAFVLSAPKPGVVKEWRKNPNVHISDGIGLVFIEGLAFNTLLPFDQIYLSKPLPSGAILQIFDKDRNLILASYPLLAE